MNFLKLTLAALTVVVAGSHAEARQAKKGSSFTCKSTLEYVTTRREVPAGKAIVKQIAIQVIGEISSRGLLTGNVEVIAGKRSTTFRSVTGYVSDDLINIQGNVPNEGFRLKYMGAGSVQNGASYRIQSGSRRVLATSEVLSGPLSGRNYPVVCRIVAKQ